MKPAAIAAALALSALLSAASLAQAANPLLGGHWLNTYRDPNPGSPGSYAYDATFLPDGRLTVVLSVTAGQTAVLFNYRMTGAASYEATAVDYEPKQNCVAVCLAMPPFIPMGTKLQCSFRLEGQIILHVDCGNGETVRYTRQN